MILRAAVAAGEGDDTNFLSWLSNTVSQAVQTADEHDTLRGVVRELRAAVEDRYRLAAVLVCPAFYDQHLPYCTKRDNLTGIGQMGI